MFNLGSGCGAVGRAVAYDMRGPEFESSHRQLLLNIYLLLTVCRRDENKEKRPGMAHFLLKSKHIYTYLTASSLLKFDTVLIAKALTAFPY